MKLIPGDDRLIDALVEWNRDEEMRVSAGGGIVPVVDDIARQYYRATYDGQKNVLIGVEGDSGEIVGCYFCDDIEYRARRCTMHYSFKPRGRGKALRVSYITVMDYLLNDLQLTHLYGTINETNKNAKSFLEKAGWKMLTILEGYFPSSDGPENGLMFCLTPEGRMF